MIDQSGMMETTLKKRILILAANPKATTQLRLDKEIREIKEGLRRAKYRSQFEMVSILAVRHRDFYRALLDYKPQIVHFTGHGNKEGLLVEDEDGFGKIFSTKALAELFKLFSNHIECVILSACYSAPHANAINRHINYVIGMRREIEDNAAIGFAVAFYDAMGAGKSVEEAFQLGRAVILGMSSGLPEHLVPVLKKKESHNDKHDNDTEEVKEPDPDVESIGPTINRVNNNGQANRINNFEQPFEGGNDDPKKKSPKKETSPTSRPIEKDKLVSPPADPPVKLSLSDKQLDALRRIHEKISYNLSNRLHFYLSTRVLVKFQTVEVLTTEEFTGFLPAPIYYMNAIHMKPSDKVSVLTINSKLLFYMFEVDISNKRGIYHKVHSREKRTISDLSDLEMGSIAGLVRLILEGLENGWEEITTLNMSVHELGMSPQSLKSLISSGQVVSISFKLTVGTVGGLMNFGIPYALIESIGDKLLHA